MAGQSQSQVLSTTQVVVSYNGVGLRDGAVWPQSGKLGAVIAQSLKQNAKATFEVHSTRDEG